jgi:glycosyltransferase involved in cell wall biosynthesis
MDAETMPAEAPRHVLMTADTVGGVWSQSIELAAGLGARGVRVSLATMGAPLAPSQRAQAAALERGNGAFSLHESSWRLEWMDAPWQDVERAGEWLLGLARELRPDVVHLNQFAFGALPFAAPKLVVAHSCVASWWRAVHRSLAPPPWDAYRQVVRDGLEGADLVAAPTEAMLAALALDYRYIRGGVVLPNGRDPAKFAAAQKAPFVLSAGRLWDSAKNLAALEAVAPTLPWPVRVAGAAAAPGALAPAAQPAVVQWLGELAPEAMAAQFARAAIYALPARYEPFGLSALEAGLSSCALVLGDIPSLREVWGDAALYVPPDDHAALHAALLRLMGDDALRQCMAQKALARARAFTPQRMVDAYLAAYARLPAAAAAAAPRHAAGKRARKTTTRETACAS